MRTLTKREERTVRIGAVGIGIYLLLFCGLQGFKYLGQKRADYQQLQQSAERLKQDVKRYEDKVEVVKKLMEGFRMDPAKLSRTSVVAEASAAIQKAVIAGGAQLGPVRESPARSASQELASIQMEFSGPPLAVTALLSRLESTGYPLIIDAVQIALEATKPGMVKVSLTIIILDFEQWKLEEPPHA